MFNNSLIVMIFPGNITIFDERKDRIMVNFTENHTSLTIKSLRLNDSGEYTLQGTNGRFSVLLSVQGEDMPEFFIMFFKSAVSANLFMRYPPMF